MNSFVAFDTSCFSGEYVTGEKIGDAYFTRLYDLRNEDAKQLRNNGVANGEESKNQKPQSSSGGCEPVTNDTRSLVTKDDMCEPITNAGKE